MKVTDVEMYMIKYIIDKTESLKKYKDLFTISIGDD